MTGSTVGEIVRSGLSVIAGFTLLSLCGMSFGVLFFTGLFRSLTPTLVLLIGIPYNVVCGVGVGYLVGLIAGRKIMFHSYVVSSLIAAITIVSLVMGIAIEPLHNKIISAILMIAGTILGGYLRHRQLHQLTA